MNLEKYVVVSGLPGVHKLVATRGNGLIIDDRLEKRTRFVTTRQNPVTPLGTIGIYVDTDEGADTVALGEVFAIILEKVGEQALPAASSASSAELRSWFSTILPNHDQDRVHINDIKKCIKWFTFMHENGMFEEIKNEVDVPEAENSTEEGASASLTDTENSPNDDSPESSNDKAE